MQIAKLDSKNTMSSREIAELIEKRHDNIKVSADRLVEKGIISTPAVQEFNHNGNTYTEYLFTKRDSLVLVAQNCPEFTARIVDRWQELEANQSTHPAVKTIKNPALALIAQLAQELDAMQSAQEQQAADLALVKSEVLTIGARTQPDFEFFTVLGYANRLGRKIDAKTAANFGRKCATLSKQCGIMVGTVPDARFGSVGTYHVSMLDSVFEADAVQK
jgi:phage regulator Rha-like protein